MTKRIIGQVHVGSWYSFPAMTDSVENEPVSQIEICNGNWCRTGITNSGEHSDDVRRKLLIALGLRPEAATGNEILTAIEGIGTVRIILRGCFSKCGEGPNLLWRNLNTTGTFMDVNNRPFDAKKFLEHIRNHS